MQQVADDYMRVRKIARVRERDKSAFSQVKRNNSARTVRGYDRRMASFAAAALKYCLAAEIFSGDRCNPGKEFFLVLSAQILPSRPFFRKARSRLQLHCFEIGG